MARDLRKVRLHKLKLNTYRLLKVFREQAGTVERIYVKQKRAGEWKFLISFVELPKIVSMMEWVPVNEITDEHSALWDWLIRHPAD